MATGGTQKSLCLELRYQDDKGTKPSEVWFRYIAR